MRSTRYASILYFFLCAVPIWAQQAQPITAPPAATKDSQAVSILNQVLSVAGGASAINAIKDYTATGNVTHGTSDNIQGTVTVRGRGLDNLRTDMNLPTGMRSEAIGDGRITAKTAEGGVTQIHIQAPMSPSRLVLPYLLLVPALNSPNFKLSYKGIVNVDGRSAHDVELQRIPPGLGDATGRIREYSTIELFIDPSTSQLLMMQDVVLKHRVRQVRYSNYALTTGVLVPFSISEQQDGQPTWQLHLSQITFNAGLQDSDFQL
jgi:hypothetical protein